MDKEAGPYIEDGVNKILEGIPGDSDAPFALDFTALSNGDITLQMHNSSGTTEDPFHIHPVRFRTFFGGSPAPMIAEELSQIWDSFKNYDGKIPPFQRANSPVRDRIAGYYAVEVAESVDGNLPRYHISGLYDDDTPWGTKPETLVDIEISQTGNATLRMTDTHTQRTGEMLFKSAKNGGENHIMAHTLTRVAERIAKAKRNR